MNTDQIILEADRIAAKLIDIANAIDLNSGSLSDARAWGVMHRFARAAYDTAAVLRRQR
jgi:hypothetical protein